MFASRLKEIRLERNMTQKDLAEVVNVKSNTISEYESGKTKPSMEKLQSLAAALNISIEELITEKHSEKSQALDIGLELNYLLDALSKDTVYYNGKALTNKEKLLLNIQIKGLIETGNLFIRKDGN